VTRAAGFLPAAARGGGVGLEVAGGAVVRGGTVEGGSVVDDATAVVVGRDGA
jgi:hypothetical protein